MPAPVPTIILDTSKVIDGGKNQNLKLFKRGKAMSGELIIIGKSQLANPPINRGIIKKKIIKKACEVINTLNVPELKSLWL
ncbi:MAG: hypothetical protein DI617_08460 [Streptococcus pyogenes]|nr:MAG: hypothetical protein DI617_08460 [Streptococcus pyogenes]